MACTRGFAAFQITGYGPRDDLVYVSHTEPGRQISRFSMRDDETLFMFVFRADVDGVGQVDGCDPKRTLQRVFAGSGWECPRILALMDKADEIYFDRVSQIRMNRWSNGQVALIGDAAACVSLLAGEGTGLAMSEAYVLAGELQRAAGDPVQAFANYEKRLIPFLKVKQQSAQKFAASFAGCVTITRSG